MDEISSPEFDRLEKQSEEEVTLVRCRTEPWTGTLCTVDGKEIMGGIVEAVEEGKKISEEKGVRAYFQNTSLNIFCSLEEFIESCPRLAEEVELDEKIEKVKISVMLIGGIAFLTYLLITI